MRDCLLEVKDLRKFFPIRGGIFQRVGRFVQAVDGISFSIDKGEIVGLVGESGCGKTTVGKLCLGLEDPTEGDIRFNGKSIVGINTTQFRRLRRDMQIIFQDPYGSLNPRMTVGQIVGEPLAIHGLESRKKRMKRVSYLLEKVGLEPGYRSRYPHEFSGGQRQRIGIARALALQPKLIICDEPVSALDVSIQAQVINLLEELQDEFGLTYLFIAHDLSIIKHISDRVAVMYLGKIVEIAETNELYRNPLHPYTQALLSAVLVPEVTEKKDRIILTGDVPSPINPPSGCRFRTRCRKVVDLCKQKEPFLTEISKTGHSAACHLLKGQM